MGYHLGRIPRKRKYFNVWKSIELEHQEFQDQDSNLNSNSKAMKVFDSISINNNIIIGNKLYMKN